MTHLCGCCTFLYLHCLETLEAVFKFFFLPFLLPRKRSWWRIGLLNALLSWLKKKKKPKTWPNWRTSRKWWSLIWKVCCAWSGWEQAGPAARGDGSLGPGLQCLPSLCSVTWAGDTPELLFQPAPEGNLCLLQDLLHLASQSVSLNLSGFNFWESISFTDTLRNSCCCPCLLAPRENILASGKFLSIFSYTRAVYSCRSGSRHSLGFQDCFSISISIVLLFLIFIFIIFMDIFYFIVLYIYWAAWSDGRCPAQGRGLEWAEL